MSLPEQNTVSCRELFEQAVYVSPANPARDALKLPYRLLRPPAFEETTISTSSSGEAATYPLVLFLHGAFEKGDDNYRQITTGIEMLARDHLRRQYPCFVVAPQCPANDHWSAAPWWATEHTMSPEPTAAARLVGELLDELTATLPVDTDRLYLTGYSMGGFGTWELLARHPRRFAAAAPICGGGDIATAGAIAATPIWAFHGASDEIVTVERSRRMIAALRAADGDPRYTEYPDEKHACWLRTYHDESLYAWLFAQKRTAYSLTELHRGKFSRGA